MPTTRTAEIFHRLRRGFLARDGAGLPDAELFTLYAHDKDEAAFAALVRRHGPMVWGVCRRLLAHHDAEDAFQATFLVLAKRAASASPPDQLAGWLHGVAFHVARKAAARAARHFRREKQAQELPEPTAPALGDFGELRSVLDQELARLPDKYRLVIVLCDLEGKTYREAGVAIGCPEGTVAGRLSRARAALAVKLSGRGIVLSAGALVAALTGAVTRAAVPSAVASSALNVVALVAAGEPVAGLLSVSACELMNGGLQAMWYTKVKAVAAAVLVAVAVGGGLFYGAQGGEAPHRTTVSQSVAESARAADDEKKDDKAKDDEETRKKALEALEKQAAEEVKELQRLIAKFEATRVSVGEIKKALDKLRKVTDDKTVLEALGEIEKEIAAMKKKVQEKGNKPEEPARPEQ